MGIQSRERDSSRSGSSTKRRMTRARSRSSPTSYRSPSTPSRTYSAIPPMFEASTGVSVRYASWIVIGLFSNQIEGTTRTSISA